MNAKSILCALSFSILAAGAATAQPSHFHDDMTWTQLLDQIDAEGALVPAYALVDVEVRWTGSGARYSGVWAQVSGGVHGIFLAQVADYDQFLNDMKVKNGRWLDIEVGYYGNLGKRWTALFLEDGDDYAYQIDTTSTETQFQALLDSNLRLNRQIVDFEAYTVDNDDETIRYAGLWVNDPNQPKTHLYYGLQASELQSLLSPLAGRVIDFERYWSPLHDGVRYAVIVANVPGNAGQWAVWHSQTAGQFDDLDTAIQGLGVPLGDVEVYETGSGLRYAGVWGDSAKALYEVPSIPSDTKPVPISPLLQERIDTFEASDAVGPLGTIGFYARNVRTGQTVSYRASEPFYLASTTKVLVNALLFREDEANNLDVLADTIQYTSGPGAADPWYVDDRNFPGLSQADFGNSFSLDRLSRGMMQVSDNAATSMLIDDPTKGLGREELNLWVAGIPGVGRGFGLITAINDLDRYIHWNGQVQVLPDEFSYLQVPMFAFEPTFRGMGDAFGDLQQWADANNGGTIPSYWWNEGHLRYFRMGLNSAEPRAFGRFLQKFVQGDFYTNPGTVTAALANWGTGTPLDNILVGSVADASRPALPPGNPIQVWAKNGGKGGVSGDGTKRHRVTNDTAILQKGPETIVMGVFSKDNGRTSTSIRNNFMTRIGYDVVSLLLPDLEDRGNQYGGFEPPLVKPDGALDVWCDVRNTRSGEAGPFEVRFYASTDATITESDTLIGTFDAPGMVGNSVGHVFLEIPSLPNLAEGHYYIGWIIDPPSQNDVGEWDDRLEDNRAVKFASNGLAKLLTVQENPGTLIAPQVPPGDDTLDVLVYHDADCDGRQSAGEAALSGYRVSIEFEPSAEYPAGANLSQLTDGAGSTRFAGFDGTAGLAAALDPPLDDNGLLSELCEDSPSRVDVRFGGSAPSVEFRVAGPGRHPGDGGTDELDGGPDGGSGDDAGPDDEIPIFSNGFESGDTSSWSSTSSGP